MTYVTYPTSVPANFTAILTYASTSTGGLFGPVLLVVVWTTAFMTVYGRGNELAFLAASTITALTAVMFVGIGFLHPLYVFIAITMMIIGLVMLPKPRG